MTLHFMIVKKQKIFTLTLKSFGVGNIFKGVYGHHKAEFIYLFKKHTVKNSNILRYYYNLK